MYYSTNFKQRLAMKRYACFILFTFYAFSSFADKLGFNFVNNKKSTNLSFKMIDNLIVIPVEINNGIKVNLVLDTGGRTIILFGKKLRKQMNVLANKTIRLRGYGNGKSKQVKISLNNKVSVADVEGNGVCVALSDDRYFFPYQNETQIHGIIGYQIFSRFMVEINYPARKITISEPSSCLRLRPDFQSTSLLIKDAKPYINTDLSYKPNVSEGKFFHIDTGSSKNILLFSTNLNDYPVKSTSKTLIGKGLNGSIYGYVGEPMKLTINWTVFENLTPFLIERKFSDREITNAAGSIGSGFLKDFIIIFDYVNEKFYFKKSDAQEVSL